MATFTITRPAIPALAALDTFVENFMLGTTHGNPTPGVTLAIVKDNRLVFARGYTLSGFESVQPTSLFRIASCTKPLTQIAIYQLVEQGKLNLDEHVQAILALRTPTNQLPPEDPKPDPSKPDQSGHYFNAVTVRNLLRHQGGWQRDYQPTYFHDVDVVNAFAASKAAGPTVTLPITKDQLASWGITQPQQYYPGPDKSGKDDYSNFGYLLLGFVIQKKTGIPRYIDAMHKNVFAPLGITRPCLAQADPNKWALGEVKYYHKIPTSNGWQDETRTTVLDTSGQQVPIQYGAENQSNFDSFGGWVMAAPDYAKVLSAFTQSEPNPLLKHTPVSSMEGSWNRNGNQTKIGNVTINQHGGGMPGTQTYIGLRSDHIGVVMLTNGDTELDTNRLNTLLNDVKETAWPQHNLFRSYLDVSVTPNVYYDGIWNPSTEAQALTYQHDLNNHRAAQKEWWDKGYRLLEQHAYVLNGQVYFDAIWKPSTAGQVATFDTTLEEHRALQKEWWDKGFRLTHQHAYVLNGQVYIGGLWSPSTAAHVESYNNTLEEHRALQKEWWDKGFRLTHQHAYVLNGQVYFGGLWSSSTAGQFVSYNNTFDEHRALQKEWWDKGFRLTHQHTYVLNGQVYFGGLWSPSTEAQFVSWGTLRDSFDANYAVMWAENMRLTSLTNRPL